MIAVYYDSTYRALFVQGVDRVWPPMSLSARSNPDGTVEIWTGSFVTRIVGPVPFEWITDAAGSGFVSAALATAYLQAQFSLNSDPLVTAHADATIYAPSVSNTGTAERAVYDVAVPTYSPYRTLEFTASSTGQQTGQLVSQPSPLAELRINGLPQSSAETSSVLVLGLVATFPAELQIQVGDLVTYRY